MGSYWDSCLSVGGIGEGYVYDHLQASGAIVYRPPGDCAHPIDFIVTTDAGIYAADVKTTPRRLYYADNTIDAGDYEKYAQIACIMPVYVFFVDYVERCAYSCPIPGEYVKDGAKVRVPLSACKLEFELSAAQVCELMTVSKTGYNYTTVRRHFLTP